MSMLRTILTQLPSSGPILHELPVITRCDMFCVEPQHMSNSTCRQIYLLIGRDREKQLTEYAHRLAGGVQRGFHRHVELHRVLIRAAAAAVLLEVVHAPRREIVRVLLVVAEASGRPAAVTRLGADARVEPELQAARVDVVDEGGHAGGDVPARRGLG